MATYVLVHGGWHGAWCWKKVVPLFQETGHRLYTPTLTGLGEKAPLLTPEVGLSTHIQDIVQLIEENQLNDVILLGHSYSGMVITGVVDRIPEQIGHLVYLDAVIPHDGESMADVAPLVINRLRQEAHAHGDGWRVNPPREMLCWLPVSSVLCFRQHRPRRPASGNRGAARSTPGTPTPSQPSASEAVTPLAPVSVARSPDAGAPD